MTPETDCLFCGIAAGRIPAKLVHEDERTVAFRDIAPQAPVHVLVIPRKHLTSLDEAHPDDGALLGHLLLKAREIARAEGITDSGYRTVVNTGDEGGQTVGHLHVHVLGGRPLKWPPG
jgi:histidine triad (HIT) family protein